MEAKTQTRRVLVVDDNPMNAHLAQIILRRAGFEAPVVESAPLALDYLCGNHVDVILSDVSMPGMSGKDLCREVLSRYGTNRPRMVAYTAFALEHQRLTILEAGFDALLVKPASREAIVAAMDSARTRSPVVMPACRHIDLDSPGLGQEGDREETARLFLELGARQWAAIDAAWRQRSTRDLSREIHKLRGSLAIVGAKAALMRAGVIEKACGTGWPAGHEQTFRELETEFAAVCAEMSRL